MINLSNIVKIFICCHLILLKVAFSEAETRIVNGRQTTINEVPFLVQLNLNGIFLCGGTLVSDRFVVTAAHCVHFIPKIPADRFTVVAGVSRRSDVGIRSRVENISIHPHYDPVTLHADVAALKLESPIIGPSVEPACFCNISFKRGDPMQVFGWGRTIANNTFKPTQVRTAEVNVISKRLCRTQYPGVLTDSMFCAAAEKGPCDGDSGGPAIVNGKYCGIVSNGYYCGLKNSPSVYISIPKVLPFIASAMLK